MRTEDCVVVALDAMSLEQALEVTRAIGDRVYAFKIHDLLDRYRAGIIARLRSSGVKRLLIDHKLHDIPRSVNLRACALRDAGVKMITVHAAGGEKMMRAAVASGLEVIAVTVLTSLSQEEIQYLYRTEKPHQIALTLARWAWRSGVRGVTCSAKEVDALGRDCRRPRGSFLMVPGTRGEGMEHHDHKRVDGAACALRKGATHLVIGRELTSTGQYVRELDRIARDIAPVEKSAP